ncbi:hypothetical protein EJB05_26440, partial [Eragrostis curvula]
MAVHLGWRLMTLIYAAAVACAARVPQRGAPVRGRPLLRGDQAAGSQCMTNYTTETYRESLKGPSLSGCRRVWRKMLVQPPAIVRRVLTCVAKLQFFHHASSI